ncbi:unnamed protein product [Periconia digitata]|uniref:Uncharacterized protein n=1 Tax=Periconia digitata TaxID=1303443 RepID=A0A9W4XRH7_9PLEO|nr:unnamed protein product [Periconia digitata]
MYLVGTVHLIARMLCQSRTWVPAERPTCAMSIIEFDVFNLFKSGWIAYVLCMLGEVGYMALSPVCASYHEFKPW